MHIGSDARPFRLHCRQLKRENKNTTVSAL